MDKKIVGLIGGAISALALLGPARAETAAAPPAAQSLAAGSFEDLLQPLPNAASILRAVDEANANGEATQPGDLMLAQYYYHHHHHHHHYRRHHHHHHHHHFRHHHHHYNNY